MNYEAIKEIRLAKNISQLEMAISLGLTTAGGYARIESGENKLKAEHLPILANKFEMDLNHLVEILFFNQEFDETSTYPEHKTLTSFILSQ